ncbi:MAG: sulfatase-like hydrolase/transferase [Phycisphaera sp.]|nr:sulfatase-like hydrolase/transferase [Phycisphaera sp.]
MFCLTLAPLAAPAAVSAADRPNVLWITSEDNGPHLGCYGDTYAISPNLDKLAAKGMIYNNAWSTAPVCAPARTTIITGMWPPSIGGQHMRSESKLPPDIKPYPQILREHGYYCTNWTKTDYNLDVDMKKAWDDLSKKAHWKNRKPGQPFFAIFNYTISHEHNIRNAIDDKDRIHDPAKVRVPAYHPDVPEVRKDWAQYYDRITQMDKQCGDMLDQIDKAGLEQDTIVVYYGDHGSGMPRSKRWPYNSGLQIPLIVYVPEKWKKLAPKDYKPGGSSDDLLGFIDLAPTLLSTCGVKPPANMQGHAFMGEYATDPVEYQFGFRGRMDERYDMVRVCRDKRYIYIRNYMPHKIYGQYIDYMFQTPTTRVWKEMYDAGKLNEAQSHFWQTKPAEELYDLKNDIDEIHNLAGSADHADVLKRMRAALDKQLIEWRDLGFLSEDEMQRRSVKDTPRTMGLDPKRYDIERIKAMADVAQSLDSKAVTQLITALDDKDSGVRYWGAMGLLMRQEPKSDATRTALREAMKDDNPSVIVTAAEALGRYGNDEDVKLALPVLMEWADVSKHEIYVSMMALSALDFMDDRAAPVKDQIAKLPTEGKTHPRVGSGYIKNVIKKIMSDFDK